MMTIDDNYIDGRCPFAVNLLGRYYCTSTVMCDGAEDGGNGGAEIICNNSKKGFIAKSSVDPGDEFGPKGIVSKVWVKP